MKILIQLGHPAHFHLFLPVIRELQKKQHRMTILIKKKDILEDLLKSTKLRYLNIMAKGRKNSRLGVLLGVLMRFIKIVAHCLINRPNLLIGTSLELPYVGRLLLIRTINVNEDDWHAVPLYSRFGYPFSHTILAPKSCSTGRWYHKTVTYNGYHELAYLHPCRFHPDIAKIKSHIDPSQPFFILRFASLTAHHDRRKTGLTIEIARIIIQLLRSKGNVYISSEKPLHPEFAQFRIKIKPIYMHHALYFADMVIGDSQTMTAEAAVLGTPALRFNDFVGKLGYLEELEHKYQLTYGIRTSEPEKLYEKIKEILDIKGRKAIWQQRRQKMLQDKIDVTAFMVWFIENYPISVEIMNKNPQFQYRFR